MSEKTVFISYRRDAIGKPFARSLKQELTHLGYDVFLDVDGVDAGLWATQILTQVPKRAHFLLLLTPHALDRCAQEDDWVRQEFLAALASGRNIVPVREESVDLTALRHSCPESMKALFGYQNATIQHDGFSKDIATLIERYIPPHKAPPPAAASTPSAPGMAFQADVSRILKYAPSDLIGREAETQLLTDAWTTAQTHEPKRPHILTFVALGGEGKTSLVAKWAADLAHQDWPGCDAVFAWSFYSQGTREQTAVSSDLFLAEALTFFGDAAMARSAQGAFDKGRRLAQLVGERRALLLLDGLEPLQYAPTSPTPGELKDQGLAALLKGLAATSRGLCVVTTRYALPDLRAFLGKSVREEKLTRLSTAAGVALLQSFGVQGSLRKTIPGPDGPMQWNEFEKLVEDVKGHALTLNLLGSYLRDAHDGDIRHRDLIKLEEANPEVQGGHAFHVMDAYVQWLEGSEFRLQAAGRPTTEGAAPAPDHAPRVGPAEAGTPNGKRALAILRLLGLFDRPAPADCLNALLQAPAIPGLTEPLVDLTEAQLNLTLTRLESAKLLTKNPDASAIHHSKFKIHHSLDSHPLVREYFAQRLRQQQPEAWRAAHRRLYEHLCATTKEGDQPTLEALQPLYQAVTHGCQAGLQQEACEKVYRDRILRGQEHYTWHKLGAFGSELGAVACFFEIPWSRLSPALSDPAQAWLLNEAAYCLRALGRLTEALEPMRAGLEMRVKQESWKEAAISYSNLSELELTLGVLVPTVLSGVEVAGAVGDAEQSVTYADRSGDAFQRYSNRTTHADALHQAGRRAEAETRFREAEQMQAESQPAYPLLYSVQGFQYCDLLLTEAERAAWRVFSGRVGVPPAGSGILPEPSITTDVHSSPRKVAQDAPPGGRDAHPTRNLAAVSERAAKTLKISERNNWLLDIALDHLTLGRAALYAAILESPNSDLRTPISELDAAVAGLRHSGDQDILPHALLTRAWLRSLTGSAGSPQAASESAQSDLDEAWEIAERGPMPLFLADIHLHRARLFGRMKKSEGATTTTYPWESPQKDLAEARRLIEKHGYGRRKEELADAEAVIIHGRQP